MDVRFPLPDGVVDLGARLVVRPGSTRTLSCLDARILEVLFAHERRVVPFDLLVREVWGSGADGGIGALEVVIGQLRGVLESPGGPRVLRSQPGLGVGLWPAHGTVQLAGDQVVAVAMAPTRRGGEGWIELAQSLRASASAGGLSIADVPGRLVAAEGGPEPVLAWARATAKGDGVAVGVTRVRWVEGARDAALDEGVERALILASSAGSGGVVVDTGVARAPRRTGSFMRAGRLPLDGNATTQAVWLASEEAAPLLPGLPRRRVHRSGPLVGRDGEIRAVLAALDGDVGLVVVHGSAGSGTTSVALAVARSWQRRWRGGGGAHVVHLPHPGGDASLSALVADSLGLDHASSGREAVGRALSNLGRYLIVIDGLGQVSDADAATLWRWREIAPSCSFVVTARHAARLPGGVLVRVEPLSAEAARALLRARTQGFPGWDDSVDDQLLDGISNQVGTSPLALELTAARARTQRPERLVGRLVNEGADARATSLTETIRSNIARLPGPLGFVVERLTVLRSPFVVGEAEILVEDLEVEGAEAISVLLDAALLHRRDDPEVGEPRFVLAAAVREDANRAVMPPLAVELDRRHVRWAGALAGEVGRSLFRAGQDRWALRRLALTHADFMRAASELVDVDPALAGHAVRALFIRWRLGGGSTQALADCAAAVVVGGSAAPTIALMRAQLALASNRRAEALALLGPALGGPPAVADMARVVALGSARGPGGADRRRRLAEVVHRALDEVGPERLSWIWDLVQILLQRGMFGDAAELAGRYVAVAAEVGSDLLRAGLTCLAWRARTALGRGRPDDWLDVGDALLTLANLGVHHEASEGLQDLVRHMAAVGRAELALETLERAWVYLQVYASPAVRSTLLLQRARALAELGRYAEASEALGRYAERQAAAPGGSPAAMDRTLLSLAQLDFESASAALDTVEADEATSPTSRRWCAMLRAVVDLGRSDPEAAASHVEGLRPQWPGEIVMRDLVAAWIDAGAPTAAAIDRVEGHVESRSVGMTGVVLRATLAAARRLAEGASGQ